MPRRPGSNGNQESRKPLQDKGFGNESQVVSLRVKSEADGTRTRNHRIDSPLGQDCNSLNDKELRDRASTACTLACTNNDDRLARIVKAWPTLAEPYRAAILALLETIGREDSTP